MASIPLLAGIYTNGTPDFRTAYPINLVPVPMSTGISDAYLRPADGIVEQGMGPGVDRGAICWNGSLYRVMGTKLVRIDPTGNVQTLGDVGPGPLVSMDYSFDRLAINSGDRLYYFDGAALTQVVDPDLGAVTDMCWIDGYFMVTDGEFLTVTELNDPYAVSPLKYGSSEADPDPVIALLRLRNEVYALNRYTIEAFDNVGGTGFPFQRIEGAQIQKGCVGARACNVFVETIAFVGSGRNEAPNVYLGSNANATKISTREIDQILASYTETQLSETYCESRNDNAHEHLYIHLPDRTLVYDHTSSQAAGSPVWFILTSSAQGFAKYRAQSIIWAYDRWNVADPTTASFGYFVSDAAGHYGNVVRWEFVTPIAYNEGKGIVFNELELVALTGSVAFGEDPLISTSYSIDGRSWSVDKSIRSGRYGQRAKRLCWFKQGHMRNWRVQRFNGDSRSNLAFARLEVTVEPLLY